MKTYSFFILFFFCFYADTKAQKIQLLQQNQMVSIRGLSVVDNQTAWASGSKGNIAITADGGKTWKWQQVKGFEKSDFRDVEAFSAKEAVIMSSGTPALILKTTDGGNNWKLCYRNDNPAYFLDAMDFADRKHGFILGDPIDGKFLLLGSKDKGKTWNKITNSPAALLGEAAFAASGTCISVNKKSITFVTGGINSRWMVSNLKDIKFSGAILPISQGKSSKGAFSIAYGKGNIVIVGGDYADNKIADSVACYVRNSNYSINMQKPVRNPAGFQSCVTYLNGTTFLSTGTSGTNITNNGGKTWAQVDANSFNVCRKAKHGTLVLLAGDQGKIAQFKE